MNTRVKVAVTYVTVLALMLIWWSALKTSESVGPVLLVAAAYTAPIIAWAAIRNWGRSGSEQGT